jgi:xanthine dehydrogenase accessory factor
MMSNASLDVLAVAQRLQQQDEPCALVTVLRVQAPASARPGDKAVVSADGIVAGWIGGGCAQPAVVKTVRQALADGRARLIRIAPAASSSDDAAEASSGDQAAGPALTGPAAARGEVRDLADVLEFGMACHSGGTLELFVDPLLPRARLVIVGDSPVATALAGLAPRVGLQVTVVAQGADTARFPDAAQIISSDETPELAARIAPGAFVVVATQGRRDLQGLRAALALRARLVGFVASERKAQVLRAALLESGQDAQAVAAIVAPVGHAIGAQTPEEIALSVLAAVVAARRSQAAWVKVPAAVAPPPPLPLPELPPLAGSCCGAGVITAARLHEPVAAAPGNCCGGS